MENRTIRQDAQEVQKLLTQREYKMAIVQAKHTVEAMVSSLLVKAVLVEEDDLATNIDALYEGGWITKASRTNYTNIRILATKAVKEEGITDADAERVYQILMEEIRNFEEAYSKGRRPAPASGSGARRTPAKGNGARNSTRTGTRSSGTQQRKPATRPASSSARTATARRRRQQETTAYYAVRILVPVLVVILLIVVIKVFGPDGNQKDTNTTTTVETSQDTQVQENVVPDDTTEQAAEESGGVYVITGDKVRVRSEPSTDSGNILGQLAKGTQVEYVKRYSNDWTVINYNGQEAYVSSQFVQKQEAQTTAE